VAALDESDVAARTFQDIWLSSVNSLLAIDQVPHAPDGFFSCFDVGHFACMVLLVALLRQLALCHRSGMPLSFHGHVLRIGCGLFVGLICFLCVQRVRRCSGMYL
jgi:hypothetical protein